MRMFTATLLAAGGLVAPSAIGQSQGVAPAMMPSLALNDLLAATAPDPSIAWVMAVGFLGLVVLRRMRPL